MAVSVRDLASGHVKRLTAAFGEDITELQRAQVQRAAELLALASALRGEAVDGGTVDLAELVRIEDMADNAVAKLGMPAAPSKPPQSLVVEFVAAPESHRYDSLQVQLREAQAQLRERAAENPTPEATRAIPVKDNVVPLRDDNSPWAALAEATNGGGGPPGVLFNAANPRGNLPEY